MLRRIATAIWDLAKTTLVMGMFGAGLGFAIGVAIVALCTMLELVFCVFGYR